MSDQEQKRRKVETNTFEAVKRVSASQYPDKSELLKMLQKSDTPTVVVDALDTWPALSWSPEYFARTELGMLDTNVTFFHKTRGGLALETESIRLRGTLTEFVQWMHGKGGSESFKRLHLESTWGYVSYKYFHELFGDDAKRMAAQLRWESLGMKQQSPEQATFWMGSKGAKTQCHYDTYGTNMVAQLYGIKRWILIPPESKTMNPSRLPFEESTVFSGLDMKDPDNISSIVDTKKYMVDLAAGEVLYVPRHWWHNVESLSDSISVNSWLPHDLDQRERVNEALIRVLLSKLCTSSSVEEILNTGERLDCPKANYLLLQTAITELSGGRPINLLGTISDRDLIRAISKPEVVQLVADNLISDVSSPYTAPVHRVSE